MARTREVVEVRRGEGTVKKGTMYPLGGKAKLDNGSHVQKVMLRERVARQLSPDARVLEAFAGEGAMYRAVWARYAGATLDLDVTKAERAAVERPRWAVYHGNAEPALAAGWMGHVAFDVVDIDSYGAPWPFVRALLMSSRAWAPRTTVVMTDGYLPQIGMAAPSAELFPGYKATDRMSGVTDVFYIDVVSARLREWGAENKLRVAMLDLQRTRARGHRGIAMLTMVIERGAPAS